jgi:hypothetical protein
MASYEFTGDFESHVEEMLNILSIQYNHRNFIFACLACDDESGQLSTFSIERKKHSVHITRTDHEFKSYHNQLVKISKYLQGMNITFIIPKTQISTYTYTKEDNINELSFIKSDDAHDAAFKCQMAFTMLHYMLPLASQCPDKPYFTDECPYFTHITEWVYNKDELEVNQYLRITYVTQIVLSLKFIYVVAHIPYLNPTWITKIIPFVMIHMKSCDQHIQRTALMTAIYLYREKKLAIFKEVSVTLVSGDINAKMYLNELK